MPKRPPGDDNVGRMQFLLGLRKRGIGDPAVLRAMDQVPREHFVETGFLDSAYADQALPIACGQTISQPYVVAYMTQQLRVGADHRVLEVGTGSGYQAAVLSRLAREVISIERYRTLAETARSRLSMLGYDNVEVRCADGNFGWPEAAPFDAIVVTAAGRLPPALLDQLKPGGRLVIPLDVAPGQQELFLVTRNADGTSSERSVLPVRFVPLTGSN